MRRVMRVFVAAILVVFASASLRAQDQKKEHPSVVQSAGPDTQFRIGFVVSEYDGGKEISSLPYMLNATSSDPHPKIRTGVRVPVVASEKSGESSYQYIDVGTNVDCTIGGGPLADGRYRLDFVVNRSSLYVPGPGNERRGSSLGYVPPNAPMIRQFFADFNVLLRDGQTQEGTSVTDPLTGHVTKVQVTLNIVK